MEGLEEIPVSALRITVVIIKYSYNFNSQRSVWTFLVVCKKGGKLFILASVKLRKYYIFLLSYIQQEKSTLISFAIKIRYLGSEVKLLSRVRLFATP